MKKREENSDTKARTEVIRQLKQSRKELHLTQEVLAERAGTQKSNISRLESGKYNPTVDFLVKVAGCMNKTLQIYVADK